METALEQILTSSYKADMISYMNAHPENFDELIKLAISDKKSTYSWRAAWLLWSCMKKNDSRLQEYLQNIITNLSAKNDNQLRELLIVLHKMEITEELEGSLLNTCITVWTKTSKKPSVRFNAFKIIIKIAQKHPDLYNEIELLTQNQYLDSLSLNARKSIFRVLNNLTRKRNNCAIQTQVKLKVRQQ